MARTAPSERVPVRTLPLGPVRPRANTIAAEQGSSPSSKPTSPESQSRTTAQLSKARGSTAYLKWIDDSRTSRALNKPRRQGS